MATATCAHAGRTRDLAAAAGDSGVVWAGMFVLGVGLGVLVTAQGLPWWWAPIISATVFAGSVEFVLVGMLATGAPLLTVAVTTFLINSRHLFYGLSFPLQRVRGRASKAYSVFALCDEAYAVATSKDADTLTSRYLLWTQFGMHASWAGGSFAGALVGSRLLDGVQGLDFVLTALFIVLAMEAYRTRPDRTTVVLAVCSALIALALAPGSLLLVAMTAFSVTLAVRHVRTLRDRGAAGA